MREDLIDRIFVGDTLEVLKTFPDEFVDCVITSPPYWGLRDYGVEGQIGQEKTPEEYVEKLVTIFREVKRVLKKTGTFWLNLGDSYAGAPAGNKSHINNELFSAGSKGENYRDNLKQASQVKKNAFKNNGIKPKDIIGIPWRVAFALQQDGWWLRQDIIWAKQNPTPESVKDRCTRSHEYIFLLSKSPDYYFDSEAIREETPNKKNIPSEIPEDTTIGHNKRDVWWVSVKPFKGAHFATFPKDLVEPMILAGCPEFICNKCGTPRERIIDSSRIDTQPGIRKIGEKSGSDRDPHKRMHNSDLERYKQHIVHKTVGWTDCGCNAGFESGIVLDPFMGAGTTAVVAKKLGRHYIGIELNPEYVKIANERIAMEVNNEINF
jgi:DNA modification methylase